VSEKATEFWSIPAEELMRGLGTGPGGLSSEEARQRVARYGPNRLKPAKRTDALTLLLGQFKSPIVLILIFAAALSFHLGDRPDAVIIMMIVLASGLLGFWQERGATNTVQKLLALVRITAAVVRDGAEQEVPAEEVVPGDMVALAAGAGVPGDCLLFEAKDLYVDEAALTGESYPVEKAVGALPPDTPLAKRTNAVFMGTHVVSGTARALVVSTARATEFGRVAEHLRLRPAETEFERGVRRFGYFLMEVTLILVIAIFAVNVYLKRPVLDSFLFALALAVGLTPQLLPAIVTVNLAYAAKLMARQKVIVKRLASIENFGAMNVLCSDKTGTLTEGKVQVQSALDVEGKESEKTLLYAYLNAYHETGFPNPIDEAVRTHRQFDVSGYGKLDEVPYDFVRKRLSILVAEGERRLMVTKGALENVLAVCSEAERSEGALVDLGAVRDGIEREYQQLSGQGFRVLGVAYRDLGSAERISKDDEAGMTFCGFLVLFDPPKADVVETLRRLKELGISLKIITGDNRLVAAYVSQQVWVAEPQVLTASELGRMSDMALVKRVNAVDVFAEVEPNQKERIILALRKAGNVVGYLGDGINDAPALHAADVGLSVDTAVDVAKDAADIVLLEKDLAVLVEGVRDGRRTFSNTLKYVFMATSANFGNMFSMAGASLFVPFLPLLPKQILLMNLLTDFPEMTIASDSVDTEMVMRPRRWNLGFIRQFMLIFGLLSSVFDYLTFGALLLVAHASRAQFRTGWFVESVVSASVTVLVVRSRRPFFRSRPSKYLLAATLVIVAVTLVLPVTPVAGPFGFVRLGMPLYGMILGIVVLYILSAEVAKRVFYRRVRGS
jgi:Mg2+-importing ATPase